MENTVAVSALSALAHEGRLDVLRLLVKAGAKGLAAGDIARAVGAAPNTLSANLKVLSHAGLIGSRRSGRSIIYHAAYDRMAALLGYLVEDCCQGSPAVCAPLTAVMRRVRCCPDASAPLSA